MARKKTMAMNKAAEPAPEFNVRFLYAFCNDVNAMRRFYTELLAMKEGTFLDTENWAWVTYKSEGFEIMFFRWDHPLPVEERWAWQPGEAKVESVPLISFSLHYAWPQFMEAVKRLQQGAVRAQTEKPTWRQGSYWGWTIADPMGHTIEVYSTPPKPPKEGETPEWVD